MTTPDLTPDQIQLLNQTKGTYQTPRATELKHRIIGQDEIVRDLFVALMVQGHVLMIGVPGLAKTLIVRSLAEILDLTFQRIQFTPDLMPSDVTGTEILEESADGKREFRFVPGPVFANLLLADEINRTPPKTQASLLEAMQERRVTVAGSTYLLPAPFFVLATQNPDRSRKEPTLCPRRRWIASCSTSASIILHAPMKSRFCRKPHATT